MDNCCPPIKSAFRPFHCYCTQHQNKPTLISGCTQGAKPNDYKHIIIIHFIAVSVTLYQLQINTVQVCTEQQQILLKKTLLKKPQLTLNTCSEQNCTMTEPYLAYYFKKQQHTHLKQTRTLEGINQDEDEVA